MRLIDADALKEMKFSGGMRDDYWMIHVPFREVMENIDKAPTIGGWINVKDRLPEKSAWYLVSLVNTRIGHRWKVPVPADYSHGKWHYAYLGEEDATWTQNNIVTHWMPLPEPPEEVIEDE